jgi:PIN domain nuclease of toxin-antitoxin system
VKLLLDTHIWLWSTSEPSKISRSVARALADSRNEIWVSPVSTWEVVVLYAKGRLRIEGGPEAWIQRSVSLTPLREAPLTHEIALATRTITLPHNDPADRLLAATALVHGLTLVTADRNLSASKQIAILLNR